MFHRMLNQQSINLSENKNTEIIKDPYILEFLGLQKEKEITENKLENALCKHLEHFFASRYKTVLPTEEELKEELEKNRHFLENKSI